jgi:hypothetical protein
VLLLLQLLLLQGVAVGRRDMCDWHAQQPALLLQRCLVSYLL